jgi:flagellar biosynthesis/type III secretory pathway protein FliH
MEASMQTKRRSTYERIVWEEGLEQGLEQGLKQGREQGRHAAVRELLLDQVAERFGPCSEGLRTRVQSIQDEAQLRQLGRAILKVSTLAEFEARVGPSL